MAEATLSSSEEVTAQDIRVFKTTLLARRFPGLQKLSDKDVVQLILADRKAAGRKLDIRVKTYPKTDFTPPSPKKAEQPPIFYPINPHQAKTQSMRPDNESFIGIGTPYDADHRDLMEDKVSDEAKRCPNVPFRPSCTSQAKDTISIDYFLYSQDAADKQEELAATRKKGAEQLDHYTQEMTARRGQMLV